MADDDEVEVMMKAWLAADASVREMVDGFFERGVLLTSKRAKEVDEAFTRLEELHAAYREACVRRWG